MSSGAHAAGRGCDALVGFSTLNATRTFTPFAAAASRASAILAGPRPWVGKMRPRGGGHNLVPRVSHRSREGSLGRTASGDGSKVPQPAHADVAAWCGDTVGPVEPSRRSPSLAVSGSVIGVV